MNDLMVRFNLCRPFPRSVRGVNGGVAVNRQIRDCQPWCQPRARRDGGPLAVANDGPRRCGGTARGT